MSKVNYLEQGDKCKITSNHAIHAQREGIVYGLIDHSPSGTKEVLTKVLIHCKETSELFEADQSHVVKLNDLGEAVPFVEEKATEKPQRIIFGGRKEKAKKSYTDRIIEWGEYLRLDLYDGTVLIKPHSSSSERWENSKIVARLNRDGELREMHPKHKGWAVRGLESNENGWIFVNSLEEAENYELPLRLDFDDDDDFEDEDDCIVFVPYD